MSKYLIELTSEQLCMLEQAMWDQFCIAPRHDSDIGSLYEQFNGITAKPAFDTDGKQIIYSFCS